MRSQHQLLRTHALGPFRVLLQRVAVDPAMLIDLDNASNVAGDEQENFARELMELYTIGNGMFSEDEVLAMARAWTGAQPRSERTAACLPVSRRPPRRPGQDPVRDHP